LPLSRRIVLSSIIVSLLAIVSFTTLDSAASSAQVSAPYLLVGGQYGTWFTPSQSPRFLQVSTSNPPKVNNLTSSFDSTAGTVWTGATNGSQWLISGWMNNISVSHDPHIYLYSAAQMKPVKISNYSSIDKAMSTWWGGDIFTASWGAQPHEWLVAGLGSGCAPKFFSCSSTKGGPTGCGSQVCPNHMALGLFNGKKFVDLSQRLPFDDFILYASAWNGEYWLVGGGYLSNGILFTYNPSTDAIAIITTSVPATVTSIGWNGKYFLVGGMGFLDSYNGRALSSLTASFNGAVKEKLSYPNSVDSILWNSSTSTWYLAGGLPMSLTPGLAGSSAKAWVASYKAGSFVDLTAKIIPAKILHNSLSAVLSMAFDGEELYVGGYYSSNGGSTNHDMLLLSNGKSTSNLSSKLGEMSYVDWLGFE
jgi:hypothetical protein